MRKIYECKLCNYITKDRSNLFRHKKTKKHIKNAGDLNGEFNRQQLYNSTTVIPQKSHTKFSKTTTFDTENLEEIQPKMELSIVQQNAHICNYCNCTFIRNDSLVRHLRTCSYKRDEEYKQKMKQYENECRLKIKQCKDENKHYKNESKRYKEEADYYKKLFMEAGGLVKKSVSAMTHTINNYQDAPALKTIEITDIDEFSGTDNKKAAEDVLSAYRNKTLNKYLGDIIVGLYKKDDPKYQSMWSSDVSRLTYLVKRILENNESSFWFVDNDGIFTKEQIIQPVLDYVKNLIINYVKFHGKTNAKVNSVEFEFVIENTKYARNLVGDINNDILGKSILKYIAPHFKLNCNLIK